jgi:TetR/AcrR family transcriptional regulator, cholesterol catabolism regulator
MELVANGVGLATDPFQFRSDNRRVELRDAAAALFATKGFHHTSIRDIVKAVGMLPGSLYYHYANKDELLLAVYAEGVRRIDVSVARAVESQDGAWDQLEAACIAHLVALLDESAYAKVVVSVHPDTVPAVRSTLASLRDDYEARFVRLLANFDGTSSEDIRIARMLLLGALNWTPVWFRAGGLSPESIAKGFLHLLSSALTRKG